MLEKALYIVATPIGNLEDISERAKYILKSVDIVAAEDTRHGYHLLSLLNIKPNKPLISYHDHNEKERTKLFISYLKDDQSVALISDAGTPLISDPGFHLVKKVRENGYKVIPIPGPCALITALSVSGLPSHRFCFEGFLPAKLTAKKKYLELLKTETRTLIFYESPHRILDTLKTSMAVLGEKRPAVLAREITKKFETIRANTIIELYDILVKNPNEQKGEFVLLIQGFEDKLEDKIDNDLENSQKSHLKNKTTAISSEAMKVLQILLAELSIKQASELAAKITGVKKRILYDYALKHK